MKEAWLFGRLDTLGGMDTVVKTEQHARTIVEGLANLVEREREIQQESALES